MAGEWCPTTIGELCDAGVAELATGPFGSQLHAHDYVERGIPVVPTEAIRDRRIDHSVLPQISTAKATELERHRLRRGDILFARRGVQATGHIGCVREAEDGFVCGTGAIRLRINERDHGISTDFVSHVLADPASVAWFKFHAIGATMPNLNESIIRSFPFVLPPLGEQRAIAHILGMLDDKIELNRRLNETLEAMAGALFKSWFVDFDPVRAKGEGRDPGLPQPLADLFPNSFEDSELGEIPKGWKVGPILEHARLISGGTPKTDRPEYWDGAISWASAKDVSQSNGSILVDTEWAITPQGLEESATQLIPAFCSVVVARGATTGRMVLFGRDMAMNQTCYALATTTQTPFALYCRLRVEIDALVHAAHGSVFDTITTSTFASSRIVLPPRSVLTAFEERVAPVFQHVLGSIHESRTLTALRDALLPKLISGELRVNGAVPLLAKVV
jgi:type I restriction enzyme, S subunit